ncbi:MAG TPA: MotA/TolQ/ExbB proton channel family protein [Gammaproteobacteria bacterium]|nr:MotA/TolQ/ExbB proton channel family protein [Gammaproteobacteria bacterium]
MRKILGASFGVSVVAALFALPAFAQTVASAAPAPASSLDELLQRVEKVREGDTTVFQQRVAAYNAASAEEQAAMMKKAVAQRDGLQAASKMLSDKYSDNELQVGKLKDQLAKKADSLGLSSLFGLAKQAAGQVASTLDQSLIVTQFPPKAGELDRADFLQALANQKEMPTVAQLERLWFEIHREMTAEGQVVRYEAPVVQANGEAVKSQVIRIGPFTATSNGRYLRYLPNLQMLSVLPRELPGSFRSTLANFQKTTAGYVPAVVDSSRGVLTGLYIERPTWFQRIQLGNSVGYIIITVGIAGALAFLFQLVRLIFVRVGVGRQLKNLDQPKANNPLGRVLLAFKGDPNRIEEDSDVAELRISEAVLREVPKLEAFQAFLRLAVAAGPLLGLIGTVIGMIYTFQSITESGTSDPKLMANGIGQAMIATVLGLSIAIPLLFANALLNSLSRSVIQVLDEQSAGILAESIERRQNA